MGDDEDMSWEDKQAMKVLMKSGKGEKKVANVSVEGPYPQRYPDSLHSCWFVLQPQPKSYYTLLSTSCPRGRSFYPLILCLRVACQLKTPCCSSGSADASVDISVDGGTAGDTQVCTRLLLCITTNHDLCMSVWCSFPLSHTLDSIGNRPTGSVALISHLPPQHIHHNIYILA